MELQHINSVYFVGIGGIGMSALARYFLGRGCMVAGYDKTRTPLTIALEGEGAVVTYTDAGKEIPVEFLLNEQETLVVYTPAIPRDSNILRTFEEKGWRLYKRSEVLGIISKGQYCIAVAGTHGKTTTSCMVAHILTDSGFGCTAFLGGIATNYESNFLIGNNNVVVVEADEYDRSFLTLSPDLEVITSMDADHLDIYGNVDSLHESFSLFAKQLKPGGSLFVKNGLDIPGINYSASEQSPTGAKHIRVEDASFLFDYFNPQTEIKDIRLMLPGKHNVENAVAAISVALKLGISEALIKAAVSNFRGVKRRFEYIVKTHGQVYIDDYAHHPTELAACFDAARLLYPDKRLTVIFQPHLFSRTRDFADGFAEVLSRPDELLLLEIYPARELPISGIDSKFLLEKVQLKEKRLCGMNEVLEIVKDRRPELLLTVGAGDIDRLIEPIKHVLTND
ncbi:UDP-N-acetylmuramate--L-alanine ligase [Pedobacter sp. JY14-1]|uniref:UDP-N-acetylmuramate--L-alanine ligase n=1 Tax=Pedobacter sp. JY14-1 TaxID=3034151 RepID=UPI0023E1F07A|nr:UDP-N-acetylmuramate--L-alanine ligase [Pedobacter sp. JY14-1]